MNNKDFKKDYFLKGLTAFLVIAACVVFAFLVFKIDVIWGAVKRIIFVLNPVIFGLVIAYLVNPMVNFFDKYICKVTLYKAKNTDKARRVADLISVILAVLVFSVIIVGLFLLVIPQLITSISSFIDSFPARLDAISAWGKSVLKSNAKLQGIFTRVLDYEKNWLKTDLSGTVKSFTANLTSGVLSVVNFFKNFVLGLIFAIYMLFSKDKMLNQCKKVMCAVFSDKTVGSILSWLSKSNSVFSGFINGKLLDSLIMGVLCFIGTTLLNIPYALLVSVIVGVTNVIPVFGPYIGGVPSAILVTIENPVKGLYFAIFVIFLQMLDGNFIGPKILGNKTGLSNFWVMFAIVVGGGLFGVLGMLIGVPAFAVIYYAFAIFINYRLRLKNKPTDSECYNAQAIKDLCESEEK